MPTIDPSKIAPVVDVYRLIRDEVPLGKIIAPMLIWALTAVTLVWSGGVIWRTIGAPVLHIGTPQAPLSVWETVLAGLVSLFYSIAILLTQGTIRQSIAMQLDMLALTDSHRELTETQYKLITRRLDALENQPKS